MPWALWLTACGPQPAAPSPKISVEVPDTRRGDLVENIHGIQVADPYRWLEAMDSPEVEAWVEAQNRATFSYLERLPGREALYDRLEQLWNFERYGIPVEAGGRYLFGRNDGLQDQSPLYVLE